MRMNVKLRHLLVRTRRTTELISFGAVTFLHGPVGTGKSTVARLVDYCFGGEVERTPAIQQEFVGAELSVVIGDHECVIERSASDTQVVRVTWIDLVDEHSLNVPLAAQEEPILGSEVYNLSDLLFYLSGVTPIKVRRNQRESDAPLVRLSFRDIWFYCYLDQTHLDSSFFRLEDPFRGRKSQDAMRFFTGLFSERLSQLEQELARATEEQRVKRESVSQIRQFMSRFELGSDLEIYGQLQAAEADLKRFREERSSLESSRIAKTHPSDRLRERLRALGEEIGHLKRASMEAESVLYEQQSLRAELITSKIKAQRAEHAGEVLTGVDYVRCPQCGTDISGRPVDNEHCHLCGSEQQQKSDSVDHEILRRDLNERIDQLADSIARRRREIDRTYKYLARSESEKNALDGQLQDELRRYDSAFIESIRETEREIATLTERIRSLQHLRQMPAAIDGLENEAGRLQGKIDNLRSALVGERDRLRSADANISALSAAFKDIMLEVGFPGVSEVDGVAIDPRNWQPRVLHGDQSWGFWDTGSGGKKTLFNVCYALALHSVALEKDLPVPNVLIVDSPTKNISDDENPELVRALYDEVFRLAERGGVSGVQLVLIDSDLVLPQSTPEGFIERRLAGEEDAPALISYYSGP